MEKSIGEGINQKDPQKDEKVWACEWVGPRGGKWWTEWVTYNVARDKFEEVGESGKAQIIKRGGIFNTVIERNKTSELLLLEGWLKDDLKEQKKLEKSIAHKREKIRELKKAIKKIKEI